MGRLAVSDWVVLALYGAVVVTIGFLSNRRQKTTEDYLLGGRRMRWWAIGVSLIATSFSSVALIGGTGFGFRSGLGYLQLQLGDLLAIGLAVAFFLPFFSRLGLTTAYEYLERRFGVGARTLASLLFIVQTVIRTGILVLGPAVALTAILGVRIEAAIVVSGAAAILYSAAGGLSAVVWTDLVQLAVVVFAVCYSVVLVASEVPGGMGGILDEAGATGRLQLADPSLTLSTPLTIVGALIAYGTLALSVAGTGQQAVQRYLACEDLRSARKAALLGWAIGVVAVGLTLFLGVALHAWSELAPTGADLAGAGANDQALPRFIVHRLPAGISGLLVAAIFAASMSSMDSAIHSMATATLVDFVRRFRRRPLAERSELRLARALTVAFGVLATAVALLMAEGRGGLLDRLLEWLGYAAGPLLAMFLLGMGTRRVQEAGALIGVGTAAGLVVAAVLLGLPKTLGAHPLWLAPASCTVGVLVGCLAARAFPPPRPEQVDGLTLGG